MDMYVDKAMSLQRIVGTEQREMILGWGTAPVTFYITEGGSRIQAPERDVLTIGRKKYLLIPKTNGSFNGNGLGSSGPW